MADEERGVQPATDALVHERRDAEGRFRWRIGVGITLLFGVLATAMSVLHYLRDSHPEAPTHAPAAAPARAAPAATGDQPKERGRDGHRRGD